MLIEEIVIVFEMVGQKKAKRDVFYWNEKKTNDHRSKIRSFHNDEHLLVMNGLD